MIDVLDTIKQAYDISTTQIDKMILNGKEYRITNVEYYDDVYEEGNIFGTAISRCLDFEIENIVNLEGQEIEYLAGIIVNGTVQWISLGNFIVQDVEPNDTTNIAKVTAMDYMLKTNIEYKSTLNYTSGKITLLQVLQEACTNSGLVLATTNFANKDFIVDSNQFAEGSLNRQVIQAVAQISGTVAKIKNDNKLYLINPNEITIVSKVFTLNNYKEAEIKRKTHPINLVSLSMTDIEGENITLRDEESILQNGENSLVINDNPFAYTQAKKEQLITALFNVVKGFEYKAFSFKCQGLPYLETMDKVQFKDRAGNTYDSFVFRSNYKSPKGLESTIEAPSIIKATVNYQNIPDALDIAKRTEILVDKQNQKIESVINNVTEQNDKISQVTQTVNELNSKIGDIADITISKESINGTLSLEKINQSEPIYVKIYPRATNISYLYPYSNLYPSETLYLKTRALRFTNTTKNTYVDYELPEDLLYYDAENYDEFILDYDSQSCVINKKVGYNVDGTTYLLEKPITIEYDYPKIELEDGDYTVSLLGYTDAYLFVRLMAQNIYTTQFATRAEVNSEISQKANEITATISKEYSTKGELNAAKSEIKQTTDNISIEVSKKVGNNEIISKINQTPEGVTIDASKFNINGTVSANGNFKVDTNGNVKMNVVGGENSEDSNGLNFKVTSAEGNKYKYSGFAPGFGIVRNGELKYVNMEAKDDVSGFQIMANANNYISSNAYSNMDLVSTMWHSSSNTTQVADWGIITPKITQTSLESIKKNIEKTDIMALDIINNSDIYTYNLKSEKDGTKKHFGFIIGKKYNTPSEVMSEDKQGIDTYSMSSIMWKAIQELSEENKQLRKELEEKKNGQD